MSASYKLDVMLRLFICYLTSTSQQSHVTQELHTLVGYETLYPGHSRLVCTPCHFQMSSIFTHASSTNFLEPKKIPPTPKPGSLCHVGVGLGHSWGFCWSPFPVPRIGSLRQQMLFPLAQLCLKCRLRCLPYFLL